MRCGKTAEVGAVVGLKMVVAVAAAVARALAEAAEVLVGAAAGVPLLPLPERNHPYGEAHHWQPPTGAVHRVAVVVAASAAKGVGS